jgi:hypothetical protein
MPTNEVAVELTRREVVAFCKEFLKEPYLCYTEHGQHARFACQLYHALREDERYQMVGAHRMCRVQKEYPTNMHLDRSRRQHWDVSLIARWPETPAGPVHYDHLSLATVVEFGLNCTQMHLEDDIERLSHPDSNVHQGFIAHLYRLSVAKSRPTRRDLSPRSKQLRAADAIQPLLAGTNIEVYFGVYDPTNKNPTGLWRITAAEIAPITPATPPAEAATIPEDDAAVDVSG